MSNYNGIPNFNEGDEIIYLLSECADEYFEGLLPHELDNTKVLEIIKNSPEKEFILTGNDDGFFLNGIKLPLFEALNVFKDEIGNYSDSDKLEPIKLIKKCATKKEWDLWMAYYDFQDGKFIGGICPDCGKKMYVNINDDEQEEINSEFGEYPPGDLKLLDKVWKKADHYRCTDSSCGKKLINPLNFQKIKNKNESRKDKNTNSMKKKGFIVKTQDELTEAQKEVFHSPEESSIFKPRCGCCGLPTKNNYSSTTLVHNKKKEIVVETFCNNCGYQILSSHGYFK